MSTLDSVVGKLFDAAHALPKPIDKEQLTHLVVKAVQDSQQCPGNPENRRSKWEHLLRQQAFTLARKEGDALRVPIDESIRDEFYSSLQLTMDLVLLFTEQDTTGTTDSLPFNILQDLFEVLTIQSCSPLFSWLTLRAPRLTIGMQPQKGKALVLLRTLNDLLRRLSKVGGTTLFCGRILTFLSGVFPLGERSGVNLRGEYGPTWDMPGQAKGKVEGDEKTETEPEIGMKEEKEVEGDDKMAVDEKPSEKDEKDDFYNTFWSLQLPFSRPPLFANPTMFAEFQQKVDKVLPVIKEATAKERIMMGNRNSGGANNSGLKRKRAADDDDSESSNTHNEYFFAKFLTSPLLLDLQFADTHFRRQFLFQLLILLNHLLMFTKEARETWMTPRNRNLQMDFTLDPEPSTAAPAPPTNLKAADVAKSTGATASTASPAPEPAKPAGPGPQEKWVRATIQKATEGLQQTAPGGRAFAETVQAVLERDRNWILWKNDLCTPPFDKEPWSVLVEDGAVQVTSVDGAEPPPPTKRRIGLEEATRPHRLKLRESPKEWEHALGNKFLTDIWDFGYRELADLEPGFNPGEVRDFVKQLKKEDARIMMRTNQLDKMKKRDAPPPKEDSPADAMAVDPPATSESVPASSSAADPTSVKVAAAETPLATPGDPAPSRPPPNPYASDPQIAKLEENKQRIAWLALRVAREKHLRLFPRIGYGDIELLQTEIERFKDDDKEEKEKEKEVGAEADETKASTAGDEPMQIDATQPPAKIVDASPVEELSGTAGPEPPVTESIKSAQLEDMQTSAESENIQTSTS